MDRLLDALHGQQRREIIDALLEAEAPMTAGELRKELDVASAQRAHFGRQLQKLYDAGLLESDGTAYAVAEADELERFLQLAANTEASIDKRRARRSAEAAKGRAAASVRRRTKRTAGMDNSAG